MSDGEILRGMYDSFGRGDVPAVLDALDPSIEWDEAEGFMYGGRHYGHSGVLEGVFKKFATEWEGFTVTAEKIVDGGDCSVVAFGRYTGKYLPTEGSMDVPFAHSWTMRGGKAVAFKQYVDTLVIAKQLGLIQ